MTTIQLHKRMQKDPLLKRLSDISDELIEIPKTLNMVPTEDRKRFYLAVADYLDNFKHAVEDDSWKINELKTLLVFTKQLKKHIPVARTKVLYKYVILCEKLGINPI